MSDKSPTARAGINLLGFKLQKELGYIFRELPTDDYGIDGEIEIRDDAARPTGRPIAAQVKSGPSYLTEEHDDHFVYRGALDHLQYWTNHSLPVVIILVDVDAQVAYWAAVDDSVVRTEKAWKIAVPKAQRIDAAARVPLRALADALATEVQTRARSDYEAIRERYLSGERRAAFDALSKLVQQRSWRFAGAALHAEAYRSLALWSLLVHHDREGIETYLKKARDEDPTSDESVVRATAAAIDGDIDAALTLLKDSASAPAANLRTALLLNAGRTEDAKKELRERPPTIERNAETIRIEALVALVDGDLPRATEIIETAASEKPRWVAIRESRALIDYFAALPPSEAAHSRLPFPLPVPLALVRHDDASLARLRRAALEFGALASTAPDGDEQRRYCLWQVAALANDPDAQAAARDVVRAAFERSPVPGPLVMWGLERGYLSDANGVIDRLKTELAAAAGRDPAERDPNLAATALRILLINGRASDARTLLNEQEGTLAAHDPDAVHFWDAHISLAEGDVARARDAAERIENAAMRGEVDLAIAAHDHPDDWRVTAAALASTYEATGDVAALYNAVRIRRAHGDWEFVLSVAEDLFRALPNLEILQRIAEAAWRTGRFRACLDWIARWNAISTTDTEGLQQTRVACLVHVDPLAAASEADALLRRYPTAENIGRAMIAFFRIGDLKALSLAARRLLTAVDADAHALLQAAQVTAVDDPDLARELLKAALNATIDDDDVGAAFTMAHQLGEDEATAPLIARMQQLAAEGRGGVRAVSVPDSLPELLQMASSHQERVADVLAKFQAAEAPVHAVAHTLGWTLAEILHLWPRENAREKIIVRHRPLLARFGGLPERDLSLDGTMLAMDITAILLAAEHDLLDAVETAYRPIRISRLLPAALIEQQRRLGEAQPSRLAGFERLLRLVDEGKIHSVGSAGAPAANRYDDRDLDLFVTAAPPDAVFVQLLPLRNTNLQPIALDDDLARRVVGLRDFLHRAREEAVLDPHTLAAAMVGVHDSGTTPVAQLPGRVFLSSVAASMLSSSDALGQLADAVNLSVPHWIVDEARASLVWSSRQKEVRTWLDAVRERVRRGLERGVYVTTAGDGDVSVDDVRDLEFETLRDLLKPPVADRDLFWIDDRLCSRMPAVIGVLDILSDLRRRGTINAARYATVLQRLRMSDVRYLPVKRDDLIGYVIDARGRDLPNTRELQTISRTLASYALDPNRISPSAPADRPHELAILLNANGVTASVLPSIWSTHGRDHERAARHAQWFTTFVYFGQVTLRASTEPLASVDVVKNDLASDIARLYLGALILAATERPSDWASSTTALYIMWVTTTFAHHQAFADAEIVAATGKNLATIAAAYVDELAKQMDTRVAEALIGAVFSLLPDDVQRAWIAADPSFMDKHGIVVTDQVNIGGFAIPARPFWAAVERAVSGKQPPERAHVHIEIGGGVTPAYIDVAHDGGKARLEDPLFVRFTRGGAADCHAWAAAHPEYFDFPLTERRKRGRQIGRLKAARDRVARADAERNRSACVFYGRLAQKLATASRLPKTAFHLGAPSIRDHLRWAENGTADVDALISDAGAEEALRRVVTLPLPLPNALVNAIAASDAEGIVERLIAETASPLSLMHATALAVRLVDRVPSLTAVAEGAGAMLLAEPFEGRFATFQRALVAVNAWLSHDTDSRMCSASDRLLFAMSHASHLLDVMGPRRMDTAAEFFGSIVTPARELLSRDPAFVNHALYPANLSVRTVRCSRDVRSPARRTTRDAGVQPLTLADC